MPDSQSAPVLSQHKPSSSAEAQIADSAAPVESATPTAAPEVLAKATPSVAAENDPPVAAEDKTEPPPVSRQEKVAKLLSLGRQSLKRDRLLIPTYDSAYKYYQQTLILEPGNDEALLGIKQIVARYTVLARTALARHDENKSKRYIERGLSIDPSDKNLLALQESLNTAVADVQPKVQPPVVQLKAQPPVAEPEPENFLSRLKAFFSKAKSADRRNEVVVEERE